MTADKVVRHLEWLWLLNRLCKQHLPTYVTSFDMYIVLVPVFFLDPGLGYEAFGRNKMLESWDP